MIIPAPGTLPWCQGARATYDSAFINILNRPDHRFADHLVFKQYSRKRAEVGLVDCGGVWISKAIGHECTDWGSIPSYPILDLAQDRPVVCWMHIQMRWPKVSPTGILRVGNLTDDVRRKEPKRTYHRLSLPLSQKDPEWPPCQMREGH
jgi:hypothetical protein